MKDGNSCKSAKGSLKKCLFMTTGKGGHQEFCGNPVPPLDLPLSWMRSEPGNSNHL